jgi:hypothetical protein
MTYPAFIVILSSLGMRGRDWPASGLRSILFIGIVLVLLPKEFQWQQSNLWELSSGFITTFGMLALDRARERNTVTDFVFLVRVP